MLHYIASYPFLAARWRGVTPILSWTLTRAPFLSNRARQSAEPVLNKKQKPQIDRHKQKTTRCKTSR